MRRSQVISISLDQDVSDQLKKLAQKQHQSVSEQVKNLILQANASNDKVSEGQSISSIDQVLAAYYRQRLSQPKTIIIVGIVILRRGKQVLICQRALKDAYVKHLSWTFISGRLETLNFPVELSASVYNKTGLLVEIGNIIHARIHPDNLDPTVEIVALYFDGTLSNAKVLKKIKPNTTFSSFKWVDATSVAKYFTTSISDEVMRHLRQLEFNSQKE